MSGISIAGQTIVNSIDPARERRCARSRSSSPAPFNGQIVNFQAASLGAGNYIDVLFRDTNHIGLDADSITDATPEFVLVGSAASNVQIDGAGVKVGNNVYRFALSKKDRPAAAVQGRHDLRSAQHDRGPVHRRRVQGHRGRDQQGLQPGLLRQPRHAAARTPRADAPAQIPTAELLSPFSGSTLSVRTLISRPYIDVNFNTGGAGVADRHRRRRARALRPRRREPRASTARRPSCGPGVYPLQAQGQDRPADGGHVRQRRDQGRVPSPPIANTTGSTTCLIPGTQAARQLVRDQRRPARSCRAARSATSPSTAPPSTPARRAPPRRSGRSRSTPSRSASSARPSRTAS